MPHAAGCKASALRWPQRQHLGIPAPGLQVPANCVLFRSARKIRPPATPSSCLLGRATVEEPRAGTRSGSNRGTETSKIRSTDPVAAPVTRQPCVTYKPSLGTAITDPSRAPQSPGMFVHVVLKRFLNGPPLALGLHLGACAVVVHTAAAPLGEPERQTKVYVYCPRGGRPSRCLPSWRTRPPAPTAVFVGVAEPKRQMGIWTLPPWSSSASLLTSVASAPSGS